MAGKITGYTSEMCQQAMIEELEELFRDMKFNGQEGEKPLQIFKQFIPTPTDDDDDVDTNASRFPCIIVSKTSGEVATKGIRSWSFCSLSSAAMTVEPTGRGTKKP